ncbi:MAG: molybdopterin dinucleotide binding domain-containing protein [Chloroflexota bacterium]
MSAAVAGTMAAGAANLAIALCGSEASEHLVVLPPEVNIHGLLDVGVGSEGSPGPLEGFAGLLVIRDDPTMRLPGAIEALAEIGTVVVIDNVLHETARLASVVIAEGRAYASAGTYTQGDFRVQRLSPAVQPEGEAVALFNALAALGTELGLTLPGSAEAALGEIARAVPEYEPAYDLIIGEGVRLAVRASGRGTIIPVQPLRAPREGLRIAIGRDLYTAADAAALRHPEADKLHRYDRIQVSEEDAARLGIAQGDEIEVSANGAALRAQATVTERVRAGSVCISSLLQGGAVLGLIGGDDVAAVDIRVLAPVAAG